MDTSGFTDDGLINLKMIATNLGIDTSIFNNNLDLKIAISEKMENIFV